MAIALRSSQTAGNASGTNLTVTTPAGAAAGDFLTAVFYREAGTLGLPSGWVQSGSDQRDTGSDNLYLTFARLYLSSAPAANYTFTLSTSTWRVCAMSCWTGTFDSDPTDVTATGGNGTSNAEPTVVSITTVAATTMVIAAHGNYNGSDVAVGTSSYTEATGLGGTELWYATKSGAGATGDKVFDFSPNTAGSDWATFHYAFKESSTTLEQEGFRFGVDDGNEAAHGWEAAQDTNITTAAAVTKLLRVLVNATSDPAAIAYKLKYQKNGGGGYTTVPLTATTITKPVIEAADCTVSGNNTAEATWAVSHPAANTGDLLIFYIAWDDSTATTGVTAPSGANGETLTAINSTPVTDASTETRAKAWYCVATGSWTATTKTFTPSATESWSATVVKIPAGEFDAATPIGATSTSAATGTAETNVVSPAYSAGASDGGGALLWFAGVDTDPLSGTNPTGWTILQAQDLGAVAHGVAVRDTEVSNSESISSANWGIAGDSWTSIAVIVRGPTVTNDLYISTSANIAAGGEDTTARLTAPSGKTTSDFVTGRRWDNENGTDTIDITTDNYTEVEWCITLRSGLSAADYFDFRVYNADAVLDTYTNTPRWTIESAAGHPAMARWQGVPGMKNRGRVSGW